MGRQVFSHPQERRAPSHITLTWEHKCHNPEYVKCDAICSRLSLESAALALSPPKFLCTPNLLPGCVGWGAEKAFTLRNHCLTITKTSLCYLQCCQRKPKIYHMFATAEKIYSTPTKSNTGSHLVSEMKMVRDIRAPQLEKKTKKATFLSKRKYYLGIKTKVRDFSQVSSVYFVFLLLIKLKLGHLLRSWNLVKYEGTIGISFIWSVIKRSVKN